MMLKSFVMRSMEEMIQDLSYDRNLDKIISHKK